MKSYASWILAALVGAAVISGCDCANTIVVPGDAGEDSGVIIIPNPPADGGQDAGEPDAGPAVIPTDPLDPNNANKDSDCDGLTDAEEFASVYPGGKKTDPGIADSDGDGILDGVELGRTMSIDAACGFAGDADAATTTIPTEIDSDADGLPDGIEDANRNGAVDAGETNPGNPDSDGDLLADGLEDANANGVVDPGETDPRLKDSDNDGINDGVEKTITNTDPTKQDSDGDTCLDGAEDGNQNGVKDPGETNPNLGTDCGAGNVPDADNDGLPDVIEDANGNSTWDSANETNFMNPDTDGDGLTDGVEDKNKNGVLNAGETNPRRKDSDCDGLIDGPTAAGVLGEDQNSNGVVDMGETDPTKPDTDADGLPDGVERGLTANPDPANCPNVKLDAHPTTTTDPTDNDSDNDGILDGAEDTNQNGQHNPGELDPNNGTDGMGPAGQVCTTTNLKPVVFREEGQPDIQLGLPATFTELTTMTVGGTDRGLMGFDPTNNVAFLVYRRAAPSGAAGNVTSDEVNIRGSLGAISNPTTQTFTTWDGFPALQAFYDHSSTGDLKAQANTLANTLVGAGAGVLANNAGVSGPFKIQAQYVRRSAQSFVVLIALAKTTDYADTTKGTLFSISDAAGGSALAQFGDANAVQCETFQTGNSLVDFLFVVDDSCSMASYQTQLAQAATAMQAKLNTSSLNYRLGLVTTGYFSTSVNGGVLRGFTTNGDQFRAWLTQNSTCSGGSCTLVPNMPACGNWGGASGGCWISTSGNVSERALQSARLATQALAPATANTNTKLRPGAQLIIIVLADADDQHTTVTPQTFANFFNNTGTVVGTDRNSLNQKIPVHGIICPDGQTCGETQHPDSNGVRRTPFVITATGGVRGDINNSNNSIAISIDAIVNSAIAAAGYKTQKPPIGASVKVAMASVLGTCNQNDIPRSRVHGFDVDGKAGTISFFGNCRPASNATQAAVSYRYWIDTTPSPDGNPPPCSNDIPFYDPSDPDLCVGNLVCNKVSSVCECPANCGGAAPPGKVCDPNKLVCDFVCTPDCGGQCSGYQTCDQNACGCVCAQNATCAPGFTFVNSGGQCGCFCDTAALNCGSTYDADPNSCSCVCKPNCGGCPEGQSCSPSSCSCAGGIG